MCHVTRTSRAPRGPACVTAFVSQHVKLHANSFYLDLVNVLVRIPNASPVRSLMLPHQCVYFCFVFPLFETWNFFPGCLLILLPVPGADLPACLREFRHLAHPIQRRRKKRKKKVGSEMLKRLHNISSFSRLIRPVGKIPQQVNKDRTFSKSPFFSSNFPAGCKYSLNIFLCLRKQLKSPKKKKKKKKKVLSISS